MAIDLIGGQRALQTGRGRPVSFCFLKDQQPLSPQAGARASELCAQLRSIIADRIGFLERTGRDKEIHLPRGVWDLGQGLHQSFTPILRGDPAVIRHLRLYSQIFTGYQLLQMRGGPGVPIPSSIPEDADEQLARRAVHVDELVDRYIDMTRYLPEVLHISPPPVLGEVGWVWNGKITNHDTLAYLERVVLLAECGKLWDLRQRRPGTAAPRILEIGSGFGGLAYHLKKLIPEARYYCVDIPESLAFSSVYLSTLFEDQQNVLVSPHNLEQLRLDSPGFTFVPNFLLDDCVTAGLQFDLVINTLSMSEMVEKQARYYCTAISQLLGPDGVFFEQNHDNRHLGTLDARRIVGQCFPFCLPLAGAVWPLTHGVAHLWSLRRLAPYPWIESPRYLSTLPERFSPPTAWQEMERLYNLVAHMQSSKFWKLRSAWFKCKKALGLAKQN